MRPVSAAWGRTIIGSHRPLYRATVCTTYQSGTTPTGTQVQILAGDVQLDGTAAVRGTLDLTVPGAAMWPTRADDLLAPYGTEVYVERGLHYRDDLVEYVGLGYYRIEAVEQDEPPEGSIRITGRDRMAGIIDAGLLSPQQFLTGASLGYVVTTLVQQVYPSATVEWDDATDLVVLTRSLIADDDRYAFLDDLIRGAGKRWYWDHRGVLVIRTAPDASTPVWDIHSGRGGVLLRVGRRLTRDGVYNAVVASGEAVDTYDPPRAVAIDNNPLSPTYFSGRFGPVPRFMTSATIQTRAQAATAADAELRRHLGLPHVMDLSAVPNPALEPDDPVSVRVRGEGRRTHILDSLTIPLADGAPMTATTREQTVVLISTTTT